MKLRSIKRQGGRHPAIPESERKLTTIPHGPLPTFDELREAMKQFDQVVNDMKLKGVDFELMPHDVAAARQEHDSH